MRSVFFGLFIIFCNSCTKNYYSIDRVEKVNALEVDFCDLVHIKDATLVKTRAVYSGIEEYWALHSKESCDLNHEVSLDIDSNYEEWEKTGIQKKLRKLYDNYWKYSLECEIIGEFEIDTISGFGHLKTKKYQITPFSIKITDKIIVSPMPQD